MAELPFSRNGFSIAGDDFDARALGGPSLPDALIPALMSAPLAMAIVDQNGFVIGWNELATALLGWAPAHVLDRSIEDTVLPPRMIDSYREILEARPADDPRIATRRFTMPLRSRSGREVEVEVALASSIDVGRTFYVVYLREAKDAARDGAGADDQPAEAGSTGFKAGSTAGPALDCFAFEGRGAAIPVPLAALQRAAPPPALTLVPR